LHEIKRLVRHILVFYYAIVQKQKPQELYMFSNEIKGIATTKELWIGTVKFNHLNLFSDQLNNHFHTFSYKLKKRAHGSVSSCFAGVYGSEFLAMSLKEINSLLFKQNIKSYKF